MSKYQYDSLIHCSPVFILQRWLGTKVFSYHFATLQNAIKVFKWLIHFLRHWKKTKASSEPSHPSQMELFAIIVNGWYFKETQAFSRKPVLKNSCFYLLYAIILNEIGLVAYASRLDEKYRIGKIVGAALLVFLYSFKSAK